jgi:hypothetical protein
VQLNSIIVACVCPSGGSPDRLLPPLPHTYTLTSGGRHTVHSPEPPNAQATRDRVRHVHRGIQGGAAGPTIALWRAVPRSHGRCDGQDHLRQDLAAGDGARNNVPAHTRCSCNGRLQRPSVSVSAIATPN